jgi:hypothetical protein
VRSFPRISAEPASGRRGLVGTSPPARDHHGGSIHAGMQRGVRT